MKLILFLLCFSSAIAQQTVYQSFEVDSTAEPRGGTPFLNTFLQTNLRKPTAAAAKGIGGRVIVSAIVEPDGSVSDVKVVNSLRPDCDREAIRAFSLFKAWKPGFKGGKPVRQQITTAVLFKPNAPFIYNNGARINYFDADRKVLPDSSDKARYKQAFPLDSNGFANGDIIVYKGKGANWKEEYRTPFVRQVNEPIGLSSQSTITIGYQNASKLWDGEVLMLSESGSIISQLLYKNGMPTGAAVNYSPNGIVSDKREEFEEGFTATYWYDNGQIREMRLTKKVKPTEKPTPSTVMAFWTSTGQQLVKDGNGRAVNKEQMPSRAYSMEKTTLIEEGLYENGLKQGLWTGRYTDGSYFYEENYDKGICSGGKPKEWGEIRYIILRRSNRPSLRVECRHWVNF
ncbi:TonB family protein [Spirosoma telluris]|uniref:TonB family protein n=1 Tax=Spirosoma telluris TaxID=2183553 RepID=UPI002FC2CB38